MHLSGNCCTMGSKTSKQCKGQGPRPSSASNGTASMGSRSKCSAAGKTEAEAVDLCCRECRGISRKRHSCQASEPANLDFMFSPSGHGPSFVHPLIFFLPKQKEPKSSSYKTRYLRGKSKLRIKGLFSCKVACPFMLSSAWAFILISKINAIRCWGMSVDKCCDL